MFLTMFCKTQNTVQTMHLQRRQTHGRTRAWVCVLWTARLSLTWEDNDTVMWDPAAVEAVNSWGTSHLCHRWLCVRGCAATNNNAVAIRSSSQWTSLTMTIIKPVIWQANRAVGAFDMEGNDTCFNHSLFQQNGDDPRYGICPWLGFPKQGCLVDTVFCLLSRE